MKKILPFLCLVLWAINSHAQTNLYVDSSISNSGVGTSWATAYKTLNEALNTANGASTTTKYVVNIAKGTYYPTGLQTGTNRDSTFMINRDGIKLYGGYPTGGGTRNAATNTTVLSGNIGSTTVKTDNSYHVLAVINVSSSDSVTIDGITISDGCAALGTSTTYSGVTVYNYYGGGVYAGNTNTHLGFYNCIFTNDSANESGSAVFIGINTVGTVTGNYYFKNCNFFGNTGLDGTIYNGSVSKLALIVDGCNFSNNRVTSYGGAISSVSGNLFVSNTSFTANKASYGGALYLNPSSSADSVTVTNCNFTNDTAQYYAGCIESSENFGLANGTQYTVITGCTFTNSYAGQFAGAVDMQSGSQTITNCVFTNNRSLQGGALYLESGASVSNCYITGNHANAGGGIFSEYGGKIDSCVISNNVADSAGGGIIYYLNTGGTSIPIKNCTIENNTSKRGGGLYFDGYGNVNTSQLLQSKVTGNVADTGAGVYLTGFTNSSAADILFQNCLFAGNLAHGNGGAMFIQNYADPSISNCTFANDSALYGSGIYTTTSSAPTITNSVIWEGAQSLYNTVNGNPVITYSDVYGGYTGLGNISIDPLFVNPTPVSAVPDTTGDYSLQVCSPLINAGHGIVTGLDLAGNTRTFNGTVDMGAYEYEHAFPVPITTTGSICVNATSQLNDSLASGVWISKNTSIATISNTGLVTGVGAGADTIVYAASLGACTDTSILKITVNPALTLPAVSGDTTICIGTADTLHISTVNGNWSSSNTAIANVDSYSGIINGVASGMDTISYTLVNNNGCKAVSSRVVNVNATPQVAAIVGDSFVCANTAIVLSNATAGGSWSSQNIYMAMIDSLGDVTGQPDDGSGADSIFYTVTNSAGCKTKVAKTVYVDAPYVSNNLSVGVNQYFCYNEVGDYLDITNATPAGGVWTSSNPAAATITNAGHLVVEGPGQSVIDYTITDTYGCTASDTTSLYFHPAYVMSINYSLCEGEPYNWGGLTIDQPGTYTHSFQTAAGCDSDVTLVVTNLTINTGVSKNGTTLTSNQSSASYQWLDCNNQNEPISGATGQTFTPAVNGNYSVKITINSCTATSSCYQVSDVSVSSVNSADKIHLYPNPTTGKLTVNIGDDRSATISVSDITGRRLQTEAASGKSTSLDLSGYAPGIYLIEVLFENNERYTDKVNLVK